MRLTGTQISRGCIFGLLLLAVFQVLRLGEKVHGQHQQCPPCEQHLQAPSNSEYPKGQTTKLSTQQSSTTATTTTTVTELPPCRVLVQNSRPWHFEVIESVMELPPSYFSVPVNRQKKCNRSHLLYDFNLGPETDRGAVLSKSWRIYFDIYMKPKQWYNLSLPSSSSSSSPGQQGQFREIGKIVPFEQRANEESPLDLAWYYDATIEITCYCEEEFIHWLELQDSNYCILHRACPALHNHPRVLSASPFHSNFFLPNVLPFKDVVLNTNNNHKVCSHTPLRICTIGNPNRRKLDFLRAYLDANGKHVQAHDFKFHYITSFSFPDNFTDVVSNSPYFDSVDRTGFVPFQYEIIQQCDALAFLITKEDNAVYFSSSLTGSMTQASSYDKPALLHQDLADLYKEYLPSIVATHTDETASFIDALDKLLDQLISLKTTKQHPDKNRKGQDELEQQCQNGIPELDELVAAMEKEAKKKPKRKEKPEWRKPQHKKTKKGAMR